MTLMTFIEIVAAIIRPQATFNKAFDSTETFKSLGGQKCHTWRAIRRQNINKLTSEIFRITLFLTMALTGGSRQKCLRPWGFENTQVADVKINYGIIYQVAIHTFWVIMLVAFPILYPMNQVSQFTFSVSPTTIIFRTLLQTCLLIRTTTTDMCLTFVLLISSE